MGEGRGLVRVAASVVGLVLTACGTPAPDAGTRAGPSPSPSASPAYLYTCGRYPFDPALLEARGDVEREDSEIGRALRDLFEHPEGAYLERSDGWRVTYEEDERVEVMAGSAEDGFVDAAFERADGAWKPVGWGDCQPRVYLGDRSPVAWEIKRAPAPEDTELVVEAYDVACAGGRKLTEGNTRYEVAYAEDAISILMTGDAHMGGECTGPSTSLEIELDEPVGDRALLDAVHYPPKRRHP